MKEMLLLNGVFYDVTTSPTGNGGAKRRWRYLDLKSSHKIFHEGVSIAGCAVAAAVSDQDKEVHPSARLARDRYDVMHTSPSMHN